MVAIDHIVTSDMARPIVVPVKKRASRHRVMIWMNGNNADDMELYNWLRVLAKGREMTATVRRALRLYRDLRHGNTDVLFDLFPAMRKRLQQSSGYVPVDFADIDGSVFTVGVVDGDPHESRAEFAAGLGDLFGDDDEDIWDD